MQILWVVGGGGPHSFILNSLQHPHRGLSTWATCYLLGEWTALFTEKGLFLPLRWRE